MSNTQIYSETVGKTKTVNFVACKYLMLLQANLKKMLKSDFFDSLSSCLHTTQEMAKTMPTLSQSII